MVQLSVLLCLIPLALENAMMQAHITQVGWLPVVGLHHWQGRTAAALSIVHCAALLACRHTSFKQTCAAAG